MGTGLVRYLRYQVGPRWFSVVGASEFWIAIALAVAFGLAAGNDRIGAAKVGDVVTALLAYAAVAFGFSLAGLTIALTLPDEEFARQLATASKRDPKTRWQRFKAWAEPETDAYSDLLFVFSWTAAAHWCVVIGCFGALAVWGFDTPLIPAHATHSHRVVASLLLFITTYAICLFLVTLFTISQVGRVYVSRLKKR